MKILKTNLLFWLAIFIILSAGPSTALAYTVNGHAECAVTGWVPYGADYHMIFDADIQFVHSHVGVIFRF